MEPHTTTCPTCHAPALVTDAWCATCGAPLREREPLPAEWAAWDQGTPLEPVIPTRDLPPAAPAPIAPVTPANPEPDYIPLRVPVTRHDRSPRGRLGSALRTWRLRVTSLL